MDLNIFFQGKTTNKCLIDSESLLSLILPNIFKFPNEHLQPFMSPINRTSSLPDVTPGNLAAGLTLINYFSSVFSQQRFSNYSYLYTSKISVTMHSSICIFPDYFYFFLSLAVHLMH